MKPVTRVIRPETILLFLWGTELIRLVWALPVLQTVAAWMMAFYVVLSLRSLRSSTVVFCLPLGFFSAGMATYMDQWNAVLGGFQNAAVFMAFFGSIVLLRAIADRRPEITRTRTMFKELRPEQTNGAFLLGAHLMGSILVVGAMAILAPILRPDSRTPVRRRAAEACQRGMCLAPLWSPFWVASAFTAQKIPGIPAWEIMILGLPMAAIGTIVAYLMFAHGVGLRDLRRALIGFTPILPPVILCALMIAGLSSLAGLTSLAALIATVPILAALSLLKAGVGSVPDTIKDTWRGSGSVRDEIVVVTLALVLGRVLETTIGEAGPNEFIGPLTLPVWGVIAGVIGTITIGSLVGIHQLISMVLVLLIFKPLASGVSDVVLMEAALIGWGFASMVGITAVSTATASTMFHVPRLKLAFGPNLSFVVIFGILSVTLLTFVNSLLRAE